MAARRRMPARCKRRDIVHLFLSTFAAILLLISCVNPTSSHVHAAPVEEQKNMGKDLVASTWKDTLATGMWLVEFFSPYCHHCRDFAPTWATVIDMHGHLADSHDFHFGRVNCIAQGDLCHDNNIKGYPTMLLFGDGALVGEFKGERSYERVSEYVLSHASDYRAQKKAAPAKNTAHIKAGLEVGVAQPAAAAAR